ncbi:hypothetical protein EYB33_12090 [Lysinibacillus sphaericus]|uniref:hypothetical protein n=1 Tax=Lysinibacillus TaxID=400634 RepID=UPI00084A4117|nr:hypothetical protein [Lysinibacillus sphaericus]OEC01287.1 hypothetical protein GY31_13390 [Lysinibacillus sphaericus]UDK97000.1 hypothetical protein EYB33_12090 [Lysinibacillus sphaericus]
MTEELKTGWILRLKKEYQENQDKEFYFCDETDDYLTDDFKQAELFVDKELIITAMKKHEQFIKSKFGKNAICNFGYTNMMERFEFVEVEYLDSLDG